LNGQSDNSANHYITLIIEDLAGEPLIFSAFQRARLNGLSASGELKPQVVAR
jgi:hypothetical protein